MALGHGVSKREGEAENKKLSLCGLHWCETVSLLSTVSKPASCLNNEA